MKRAAALTVLAFTAAACARPTQGAYFGAHSDGSPRRAALELDVSLEGKSSSEFHGGTIPGAVVIEGRDWNDTHDNGYRVALRGAVEVAPRTEASLTVAYAEANARENVVVGSAGVDPIIASFDDYERLDLEFGLRRYIGDERTLWHPRLRPFVSGSVGVSRIAEIDAQFQSDGFIPLAIGDANGAFSSEFYDETYLANASAMVGAQWRLTDAAAVELETGVRYHGRPDEDDATLSLINLETINDSGSRLVIPVTLRGRVSF